MTLTRHTPLKANKGLDRGDSTLARTPFNRKPPVRVRTGPEAPKPAKPAARKPADGVGEGKARRLVRDRSDGWCELRIPGECLGRAHSFSHRKKRSQGGPWSPSNGMASCGDGVRGCHGAITNTKGNRPEYERNGWIVGRENDPAATPVLLARPDGTQLLALLDDLGGWTPAQPHPDQVARAA